MDETASMRLAIEKTREGIAAGQAPFGAVIVRDGTPLATSHNTVWRDTDPTAHAEIKAIRAAAKALPEKMKNSRRVNLLSSIAYPPQRYFRRRFLYFEV